ncbi:hypothetical protein ABB37_10013 [Leptomonas pyrrhocoris]|uniref:Uncharacterized protein n=1 Tax=Leptomonas pyrrhocoris TaxID=157538 RepID=A0A0M9FPB0_LEPPY|nr:hypothetical protein ABB37_10013 [Leptomonas pyrrhocoris]XP_015651759.1 hypothetical protein ABB37_10013 [Leptomonas pyrrhocoris]XP_015651760.1 hypothetical protein ABB37_10013 [Leptomonas pyrrhocoris]KPA73319.1 hypothetical protein ABB37_10013 [Leptomonas pyrrhocoris]KPA73320.1 hypothetical protein ABB37_10013 [Leptomonas pyrrhocoris]KPA73321.1 hypothetical protein ABB37_10013 [Leptomonas pyrrhocoris]|eukprot:XP_015651758.1 hypothetical protein ABB37_10013 [Leptomonas pyrrhocoris]
MSLFPHLHRPAALLLLLWLLTTCFFPWRGAQAEIIDRFPDIINAFTTNADGAAVRAIYDASQLTWHNTSDSALTPFQSSSYVLCQSTPPATVAADTSATDIIAAWCNTQQSGQLILQAVSWSTLAAPGLQLLDTSHTTFRARAWDCITYGCDVESTIRTTTTDAATAPAAVGGLSVGAPCCGSTNSTFVLYNTRGLVVQADLLPVTALNNEALQLATAYAASGSSSSSAFSASLATMNLTEAMDYCLVRQLPPWFSGNDVEGPGDGGVVFPVDVAICGEDVSDRIDTRHASLALTGYTLLLVTADGVDELSFPRELIESVVSWIARRSGTAFGSYSSDDSLGRSGSVCAWHHSTAYASAYRTGAYYDCTLSDPTLLQHLPPLLLSVRNESIVDTAETNSACTMAIDLTACAVSNGKVLRFFSSGSLLQALKAQQDAMTVFSDPPIVVGVQHLRGATVAVTRNAYVANWISSDYNLATGLPLLYLATPRGTALAQYTSATSWYACVRPQVCAKRQLFYPSLNRCATKECLNVFLYHFDPRTFECSVQVSLVSWFAAMCLAVLVAEATVLYLRRSTEEAKEEHMRLVHAVQRREAGVQ